MIAPCACPRASLTVSVPTLTDLVRMRTVDVVLPVPVTTGGHYLMYRCPAHGHCWLEFTDPTPKEKTP